MALYSMTVVGLGPFGSLAAGALAGHLGARLTVAMGGLLAIAAAMTFGVDGRGRRPIAGIAGVPRGSLPLLVALPAAWRRRTRRRRRSAARPTASRVELTQFSGMELRHAVPCDFITKEKINEFLKKRVKEVAKPEEIRAEELTLKKFGLVPPDFDLAKSTVDLLTEQAAAFYDYDKKKLFITESTPSDTQEPVLAHELSHALADQNFNLGEASSGRVARATTGPPRGWRSWRGRPPG